MEFTNRFQVPADVEETFAALSDLTRVAALLPGVELDAAAADDHTGSVRVKVGPLTLDYRGTARVVDADVGTGRVRVEASGEEERGPGTALADVVATLRAVEEGTEVTVVTELEVTGKPAQFGRAVLADVADRVIATFAARLDDQLASRHPGGRQPAVEGDERDDEAGDEVPEATDAAEVEATTAAGGPEAATAAEVEATTAFDPSAWGRGVFALAAVVVGAVLGVLWWRCRRR